MTPSQRAALRELAMKATPGWTVSALQPGYIIGPAPTYEVVCAFAEWDQDGGLVFEHLNALPNRAYIAAADPQTVTALLDYIDTLEEKVKERG